ncbi:transcription factor MYB61-like isoform X1 [Salvia splendens]|uniref:transcription factor MYB61-like isoform X1 n=1 Tax=Salvia splendens TaxID=180675 RepID=UPI001C25C595|nr:transcription factor MYB61-like isoform X1 [Salvia splendens]
MVKNSSGDAEAKMAAAFASKQRGIGNWTTCSKRSGQRRSGKKWSNNQKPDPKVTSFTPQEEDLIIQLHSVVGSRWTIIAQQLGERTESDVKNVWNSKLKKKLSAMGIDPVTHKPFSQILADYGSMGAFPATRHHDLSRGFKGKALPSVNAEVSVGNQEASSFSWSDFFLEEAFAAQEYDEVLGEGKIDGGGGGGFEAAAATTSSAFVEAMIGKQDEMCSQLPCFYEEPFYY